MAKRNIGEEIIEGLEELVAWKRGDKKLKEFAIELPKAADVPQIRKKLGYSQAALASLMSVPLGTLQNWEQGRREPRGPARALLLVASVHPEAVKDSVEKLVAAKRQKSPIKGAAEAKRAKRNAPEQERLGAKRQGRI